jgi:hypothetical protein
MTFGIAVSLAMLIVIYHKVILEALEIFGAMVGSLVALFLAYKITKGIIRLVRWHRGRKPQPSLSHVVPSYVLKDDITTPLPVQPTQELPIADVVPEAPVVGPVNASTQIAADADKLQDDNLELIWTEDGKLAARKS